MKRFLLIDDDVVFNYIHTEVIKRLVEDAHVQTFNAPIEGLEYIRSIVTRGDELPELLFLDIRMPEIDGFEFLKELTTFPEGSLEGMAIYMLTSSLDDRDKMKAFQSTLVRGFKNKPLTELKLLEIFEELKSEVK
ncbi:MAG: response regulator [Bacteroidota bacterium]